MRATIKELCLLTASLAALVGHADSGDSSPFLLDTAEGTRIAAEGEAIPIAYSPRWGNAANCTVTETGRAALVAAATDEGAVSWTPQGIGGHTLTHTAGDLTYTAQFTVLGDDVVLHGGILAAGETWGTDKVHLVTAAVTVPSGISLTIQVGAVVKFMPGTSLTVASGGSCTARGVIFTHVNDDTIGGDTLMDGDGGSPGTARPTMGDYAITGNITDDDSTEYRYMPPQTLQSSISSNTRLRGYRTYIVSNSVTVASGATLTLQPGTILKFNTGCSLTVNGTLDAQGTRAAPIAFTSLKDDAHGGDANGDGDKTYAQAGDWYQISVPGTANFNYCHVLYNSSTENTGAIDARGGTVNFDNSEIAHTKYECVNAHNSGYFTARNSIFRDSSLGFGYYGSGRVKAYNCVFSDLTSGIRQSGKTLINCVFYRCLAFTDQSGDGSTFKNCVFYNPAGYGAQSYSKCGSNGNIWGNPLFVDHDSGDFRIAANSPCVDAGDGTVAPETDWWGQPRMDVKRVKDTGTPNGDGVCPDIGIYEVPGAAAVPLPDLAVVSISRTGSLPVQGGNALAARCTAGDTISFTYVVTNRGAVAATGLVRDLFRFKGADAATAGLTIDAAEIEQAYNVPTGGCATLTATITVPTLKAGAWKIGVVANAERDVYENVVANNAAETEDAITVSVDSFAVGGSKVVDIPSGGVAGAAVTGLPASGGAIVATLPNGVKFYASVGYVPDNTRHDVAGTALADGRVALFIPAHEAGETVYVTLVNESGTVQTVTLDALASADGLEVAKPADVAVTAKGPKVTAKLVLPESIRDGRIYAAWVEYSNSGDQDAELPIFTVSRTGGGATLSATAKGTYSASPLSLIGLAPSVPRGKLKPGEAGRVAFYFMSSGTLSLKLGMVTENSTSVLNGFSSVAEYRAGMSAAATRLCARGGAEPGFTEVLAQALNEKRGAGGAAVCGTLRNAVTKMPMAGVEMQLVLTNGEETVSAAVTDANGHFVLESTESGDYIIEIPKAGAHSQELLALTDGVDIETMVTAIPYSTVSGYVGRPDAFAVAEGAKVVLDDLSTDEPADYVAIADSDGYYSFDGLDDGEYRLNLYPFDGYAIMESESFSITNGLTYSFNLAYLEKGRKVAGRVLDEESGEAVTNAVVMLSRDGTSLGVLSDENGRFAFDGIAAGEWNVKIDSEKYQANAVDKVLVTMGDGEQLVDIPVRTKCPIAVLTPIGMVPHTAKFALIRDDISNLEWDFDGDGVTDSTEEAPEWMYAAVGKYTVSLSYNDADGVRRHSRWTDAVEVIERYENVLQPNGRLVVEGDGVAVESVSTNELVLSGSSVAAWTAPGTVLGAETSSKGGFVRRVVSSESLGGGKWRFTVEEAGIEDLYKQCFLSCEFSFAALQAGRRMALLSAPSSGDSLITFGRQVSPPARPADKSFTLGPFTGEKDNKSLSASLTLKSWSDPVAGCSVVRIDPVTGVKWSTLATKETYEVRGTLSGAATKELSHKFGLTFWKKKGAKKKHLVVWNAEGPTFPMPFGFTLGLQADAILEFKAEGEGSLTIEKYFRTQCAKVTTCKGDKVEDTHISDLGFAVGTERSLSGKVSASLEASVLVGAYASWAKIFGRVGGGIRVGAKLGVSQELTLKSDNNVSVSADGLGVAADVGLDSKLSLNFDLFAGANVSWKWLNIPKANLHMYDLPCLKYEWQNTASMGKIGFEASGDGLTVVFNAQNPKVEAEGWVFEKLGLNGHEIEASDFEWNFGDGMADASGRQVSHTYPRAGQYDVKVSARCIIPTTLLNVHERFRNVAKRKINVFDDKPPEPQNTEDTTTKNPKQSCDPNEMDGPDGVGEERYVKPGDWMTYTVYFENKSDADVPAQEVRVTNPLSQWLDWSTFEMRDIAFCNQVETGLAGKQNGTITVDQNDTAYKVQATVALDDKNGSVEWYLRSVDPARAEYNYWPLDGEGLLPPNDDTHRGEGHLTYRVKVRDDAPANVKIVNSASIVFDYNPPIETEPNWTNTVAQVASVKVNGDVEGDVTDLDLIVGMPYGELPTPKARAGYTFGGWYTGPNGTGRRVTSESVVQAGDGGIYAYWIACDYAVTFDANGGEGGWSREMEYGTEIIAPTVTREGYTFAGWQPALLETVPASNVTFTAQWELITPEPEPDPNPTSEPTVEPTPAPVAAETPRLWTEVTGAAPTVAALYEGYLCDGAGNVKGTIQVKVGKPGKKDGLAAVSAVVVGLDGKKTKLKATGNGKAKIEGGGPTSVSLAGGDACTVTLGAKGMGGTYGAYVIDGSLNVFASKDAADKTLAAAALEKWQGAVNVAWRLAGDGSPYQTLSVNIAAKGKAKVTGTLADGTKVSASGQLVVGENWCCVPVVYAKKGVSLQFAVWLPKAAALPVVVGLGGDVKVGKPGSLKGGAAFRIDAAALGSVLGQSILPYVPDGLPVTGGAKWTLPKAGSVTYEKGTTTVDAAKAGENPSALKLTYKAKDGTFKGSFKAYADVGGKPKATTVNVTGVLVGGTGYGTAVVKGGSGVAVTVE